MANNRCVWLLLALMILLPTIVSAQTYNVNNGKTTYQDITPIITSSNTAYDYEANGNYQAYFNEQLSSSQVVSFTKDGITISLQPHALNFNNDLSQIEQINMPQSVNGAATQQNKFTYQNAYGNGINLEYELQPAELKELLTINEFSNIPTPSQYVIDGGNPVIEITFIMSTNTQHISLDGVEWDKSSTVTTNNDVLVKDDQGNTIYYLPTPIAIDNNGEQTTGSYLFKKSANKLYVAIRIPYSFLQNAAYPLIIDPTFIVDYSPIPGRLLENGIANTYDDNEFESISDITSVVSDDIEATQILISGAGGPVDENYMTVGLTMDETGGVRVNDITENQNDGIVYNGPNMSITGIKNTGIQLDGINDYILIPKQLSLNTNESEDQLSCISVMRNGVGSEETIIDELTSNAGIQLVFKGDGKLIYTVKRGTSKSVTTTGNYDDGNWHTICMLSQANGDNTLYVDETPVGTTNVNTGTLSNTDDIFIGISESGSNAFGGTIDEFCQWTGMNLNSSNIINLYEQHKCTYPLGADVFAGHWNQTYDQEYEWYLRVKKEGSGTISTITYPYYNETAINNTLYVEKTLTGTGWFNIEIDELMEYQSNISLGHTELRLTTQTPTHFSEIQLRKQKDDTTPPNITNCQIIDTNIGCLETIHFLCTITDDVDVENATGYGEGEMISMIKNDTLWEGNWNPPDIDGNATYTWDYVYSCDISGNCINYTTGISVNYECSYDDYINIQHDQNIDQINLTNESVIIQWTTNNISDSLISYGTNPTNLNQSIFSPIYTDNHIITITNLEPTTTYYYNLTSTYNPEQTTGTYNFTTKISCVEQWEPYYIDYTICRTNNTIIQEKYYLDANECGTYDFLPIDNGTIEENYCNYCDPEWIEQTGPQYECQINGTRYVEYADLAYCYYTTGLLEDEPPYDHQTWQPCTYLLQEFTCYHSDDPYIKKVMDYSCTLPYRIEEWQCTNQVIELDANDLLQVNPQLTEKTNSLISINGNIETRTTFTTTNGLLNAYFTNKNMDAKHEFMVRTICRNGNETLTQEHLILPDIRNLSGRTAPYGIWIKDNMGAALITLLVIIIFAVLIGYTWKKIRRG